METSESLLVCAPEGRSCPMEGSRQRIGAEPIYVPDRIYYRRRVADGDLIIYTPKKAPEKYGKKR